MMSQRPVDAPRAKQQPPSQSSRLAAPFSKPCVVPCTRSFVVLDKIFFFTLIQPRLSAISLCESLTQLSVMPPAFSRNGCPAFSVIEAGFLRYFSLSHFAVGSPLKARGTSRLLSARDTPRTALHADRSGVCSPRLPRGASHDQGRQKTRLTVGAELPHFHRGRGSTNFPVATGPRDKMRPTIGEEMACQNFA
ncbi:hypothetical protein HJG60_008127 [Phyllostomus discolor]|uniref:Uncharacterized protein n=1 Tax=Phyllostomus discolor TaxID=89673 RepID=A0A834DQ20_9CHIR|nr:hypothetical protein HJG60_008127 [Phyllostomus discolor]